MSKRRSAGCVNRKHSIDNKIILITNENSLVPNQDSDLLGEIVTLRHPKTGEPSLFAVEDNGSTVHEIITFKEECRSWLIDSTVQRDGSLQLKTRFDPVFLVLPYLLNNSNSKYMQLDQIIDDHKYPHSRLLASLDIPDIEHVANVKGSGDMVVYRYDEGKTMTWLHNKVQQLVEFLEHKNINVGRGARSLNYVRSLKTASHTQEEYTRYALGIVSDYLPLSLSEKLFQHLGIEQPVETSPSGPPTKKPKIDPSTVPLEDYSLNVKEEKKDKVTKMTAGQKKLQASDKSGMRNLSSFFTRKPKP